MAEKGYRGWQGTLQNLDPNLVMFYCSSRHYSYNICNFNFLAATASCHQVIVPLILPITLLTSNSEKGSIPSPPYMILLLHVLKNGHFEITKEHLKHLLGHQLLTTMLA